MAKKLKKSAALCGKAMGVLRSALASLQMRFRVWLRWIRRYAPPGVRSLIGIAFVAMGAVGFLPIVGFWMLPLGIAIISLDVLAAWRLLRRKIRKFRKNRGQGGGQDG